MNTNNKALTLDEQIAALLEMKARSEKIRAMVAPELETLRALDAAAIDSKNHADQLNGQKGTIWSNVQAIMAKVYDATVGEEDTRHQVFTDAMDEFLNPKATHGDKVKLTTAGQYASTARKLLVEVITKQGTEPVKYAEMSVAEVRKEFRDAEVAARLDVIGNWMKDLRYAAKHGTAQELAQLDTVKEAIYTIYNPIRARKDKTSKKAEADREIRDLQQQAPTEPGTVESVVADIAAEVEHDDVVKHAVN